VADKSKIEWTDASWTPIRARNKTTGKVGWHCEHATPGCEGCYAESMNKRLGTGLPFKPGHRKDIEIFLDEEMLLQPLRWKKPRTIFVCSMTDLFADFVPDEWIDRVFAVMALCPQHTFQVLTKRAEGMQTYVANMFRSTEAPRGFVCPPWSALLNRVERRWIDQNPDYMTTIRPLLLKALVGRTLPVGPLPNIWFGTSAEDQRRYDERREALENTPAAVRFWSLEPLLGPIDLKLGEFGEEANPDWIIAGGESGIGARPMHPDWARSIRDQCEAAGVPFFFKQWGEWAPGECGKHPMTRTERTAEWFGDRWHFGSVTPETSEGMHIDDEPELYRFGKSRSFRMLDGREHNEMPEVRP